MTEEQQRESGRCSLLVSKRLHDEPRQQTPSETLDCESQSQQPKEYSHSVL
jgi:hypothetical protein